MKQSEFSRSIINSNNALKAIERRGGKRPGAGRKRRVDEGAHRLRPEFNGERHPLHITIRLREGLPGLRKNKTLRRLQRFMREAQKFGLRVNHFALLSNHLHMIAEADSTTALQRGMMSFNGRFGRWLRKQIAQENMSAAQLQRKYPRGLFKGRYHVQVIKTCRQMRNVLKYVLLNASKHFRKCHYIDQFSSGVDFQKWPELLKERFNGLIQAQVMSLEESQVEGRKPHLTEGLISPLTWLGKYGWQRG